MKNLLRRERDRRDGRLWCPLLDTTTCRREGCAHYSPDDTQECVHVLAAQAQVRIAQALEKLPGENEALKAEREELKKTIEHLTHENEQLYLHNTELAKLAGIKGA
jgi:FtsZ-binding cell division protein ZapB